MRISLDYIVTLARDHFPSIKPGSNDVPMNQWNQFKQLPHIPEEDGHVLVKFTTKISKKYYFSEVLQPF